MAVLSIALLAVCLVIVLVNIFVSFARGTKKSLVRLGTALLAAILAFFLARALADGLASDLLPVVEGVLFSESMLQEVVENGAAMENAMITLTKMLIAPLFFLILYFVIKLLLIVLYFIVCAVILEPDETATAKSHLIAIPIGVCIGVISMLAVVTPVVGYASLVSDVIAATAQNDALGDNKQQYNEITEPLQNAPVAAQVYHILGHSLFEGLTDGEWNDTEVQLQPELTALVQVIHNAQTLGEVPVGEYNSRQCQAIDNIVANVDKSPMLTAICSGFLQGAAKSWQTGGDFMGTPTPDLGTNGNVILDALLDVFVTSDEQNIKQDLLFFADVFELAVNHQLLASFTDGTETGDLVAQMYHKGTYHEIKTMLATYPRMAGLRNAIVDVAMRALLKEMGLSDDYQASHGELLTDMTVLLQAAPAQTDGTPDEAVLAEGLAVVMTEHDINVNTATVKLVAEGMADCFTTAELQTMTAEQIVTKLIERFEAVDVTGLSDEIGVTR